MRQRLGEGGGALAEIGLLLLVALAGCGRDAIVVTPPSQPCASSADCQLDQVCRDGVCTVDRVCTPGERICEGDDVLLCGSSGRGTSVVASCEYGCASGSCRPGGSSDIVVARVEVEWVVLRASGRSEGRISWQISNPSTVAVPGGYRCLLEAVEPTAEGAGNVTLAELRGDRLGAGEGRVAEWDFSARTTLTQPVYRLGVACDVDDVVSEQDEGNNSSLAPDRIRVEPELVTLRVTNIDPQPDPVGRGQTLLVDYTIVHEGGGPVGELVSVVELTSPETRQSIRTESVLDVPSGTGWTAVETAALDLPPNVVPGSYQTLITLSSPTTGLEQLGGRAFGPRVLGDGPCEPDIYEPNDRYDAAASITDGTTPLSLCQPADQDDYFQVCPGSGASLDVTVEFDGSQADVDLVVLGDADEELAVSEGTGSSESVHVDMGSRSCATIHVYVFGRARGEVPYRLTVRSEPQTLPACRTLSSSVGCDARADCRYLVPGCGFEPVPEGCYSAELCTDDTCGAGERCMSVSAHPCWNSPCEQCDESTRACMLDPLAPADLEASEVSVAATAQPGQTIAVTTTTTNLGDLTADSTDAQLLLVSVSQPPSVIGLGSPTLEPALGGGVVRVTPREVVLPASLAAGAYELVFQVDVSGRLIEPNEANNETRAPLTIVVEPPVSCEERTDRDSCGATSECAWYEVPDPSCPGLLLQRAQCGPRTAVCAGGCEASTSCLPVIVRSATDPCDSDVQFCVPDACAGLGEPDEDLERAGLLADVLGGGAVYDLCPLSDADQFKVSLLAGQTVSIELTQVAGTETAVTGLFFETNHDPPFVSIAFGSELLIVQTVPRDGEYVLTLTRDEGPDNVRYRLDGSISGP